MSQNANYDSSLRIRKMKERALAAYRRDNPGRPEFANSQGSQVILQERLIGQVNTVFQPSASNPAIDVPACGCGQAPCPQQITLFEISSIGGTPISPFTYRAVYTFSPANNNGTPTFSISPSQPFLATLIGPGQVAFDTNGYDYTAQITYTVPGCAPVSAQTAPCFLAGAQVALANGTVRGIENVAIGDRVVGAFGEVNEVLALHRPKLGLAQMMYINGTHATTAHHPHVGPDRRFYCLDVERVISATYGQEHEVIGSNGPERRFLHGLAPERIFRLGHGTVLQTLNGPVPVADIDLVSMPSDTQLYNLVVGGSHTYTAVSYTHLRAHETG
jgi:hypothetical protein